MELEKSKKSRNLNDSDLDADQIEVLINENIQIENTIKRLKTIHKENTAKIKHWKNTNLTKKIISDMPIHFSKIIKVIKYKFIQEENKLVEKYIVKLKKSKLTLEISTDGFGIDFFLNNQQCHYKKDSISIGTDLRYVLSDILEENNLTGSEENLNLLLKLQTGLLDDSKIVSDLIKFQFNN